LPSLKCPLHLVQIENICNLAVLDYQYLQSVPEWRGHFGTGKYPLALTDVPK